VKIRIGRAILVVTLVIHQSPFKLTKNNPSNTNLPIASPSLTNLPIASPLIANLPIANLSIITPTDQPGKLKEVSNLIIRFVVHELTNKNICAIIRV